MTTTLTSRERGTTFIELVVAMLVFGVVMGGAISMFRGQTRGFSQGAERMTVLQNARFTAEMLASDLRTVGSGVPDIQPYLVYADESVVAFNANYATNVASDPFAVYHDPDAPSGSVTALRQSQATAIPTTSFNYPSTDYTVGGVNSPAETISFYFRLDSSTTRNDDYVLYRRVNVDPPEMVARNLLHTGSTPFFEYDREVTNTSGVKSIQSVSSASLPLAHGVPMHASAADTAGAAVVDSLRGVRVNLTATNGRSGTDERTVTLSRLIRLPNAGMTNRKTCGDVPLPAGALSAATATDPVTGEPVVNLSWPQSLDETSGEKDVVRYVVWRRAGGVGTWDDPFFSVPSGNASYVYTDAAVASGETWEYAVAAQDCTPGLSAQATTGGIAVP